MNEQELGYGFADDSVKQSNIHFGGNFGNTYMTKFAYTDQGGKGGAQQDALDIVFNINGTDKSYRLFPVSKVYAKGGGELTDTTTQEYKDAKGEIVKDFNQRITHILKAFVAEDDIKVALGKPFANFKEFATVAAGLLPANYEKIPLDIFLEWEYNIKGDNKNTFLQIPNKMRNGSFLVKSVPHQGSWKAIKNEDGLSYQDDAGAKHPFTRNAYYMGKPWAFQLKEDDGSSSNSNASNANSNGQASADNTKQASGW